MGRSLSLFLVRGTGILAAGLLLFAVCASAHAENLDGYGIKPLAGAPDAGDYGLNQPSGSAPVSPVMPAAANASYNAAPVSGGYYPPSAYAPAGNGYYRAPNPNPPMASGYAPAPTSTAADTAAIAPQRAAPAQATRAQAAPARAYGYRTEPAAPAAPRASYQAASYSRPNPDYVLGAGDKLKLNVFDETDLSGDYTIDGSGFVRLPLVGQVRAAGYTASQLEGAVAAALARGYLKSPRVSVEVTTYRPFYIIGAVNRPGEYPYVNHMNALNAIALAGGFLPTAVESVVFVRREGSNREDEMPTDRSTPIYPGDVVRVHTTIFSEAMTLFSPLTGIAGTAALATTIH